MLVAPRVALDGAARRTPGVLLAADDPLAALQALARAWRRALGAQVIGDHRLDRQDVDEGPARRRCSRQQRRVVATAQNLNTEIGLPLTILAAPAGTEVLVLEMAMRGAGQIAELAAIAEPDVGVIVNVGPVHLELLGSLEAIAAAKAELLAGLRPGAHRGPARRRAAARRAPARRPAHGDVRPGRRRRRRSATTLELPFTLARTCAPTRWPRSPPRARSASSRAGASRSR